MENRTTRIQDLIKDRQNILKSQKELLENFNKKSINESKILENDIDKIVNNILNEKGLNDALLSGNEEQFKNINLTIVNDLINDISDNNIPISTSNFKKSTGAVDVNIIETIKDTFDKGVQADTSLNTLTVNFPDININPKNQNTTNSNKLLSLSIPTNSSDNVIIEEEIINRQNQKIENIKQEINSPLKNTDQNEINNSEILKSSEFMDFFNRASRLIERALGEGAIFDPFFNINSELDISTLRDEDDKSTKNPGNISLSTSNGLLKNSMIFQHEFVSNRPVMKIKSHPNFPEYFVAAYGTKFPQNSSFEGMNQNNINNSLLEYGGYVLLWSISTPKNPENTFVASSSILNIAFDPYCQYRYIGTSYNGEILIWDSRNGKIPCQKSNSIFIHDSENNNNNHSFPIYCMELLGSKGSQNIVTVDIDGKLCNWNLTNLTEPIESFQLRKSNSKDISVQCITLSKLINPNAIICGSEDGSLYQTIIKTNKPGTITSTFQNAHNGFITCLDYHPINDCFLSSGADWTIKLWTQNPLLNSFTLLYTFESSENYVIGIAWHPIHPGIFASIDADSKLIIYDLTNPNRQTPLCKIDTSNHLNSNSNDIPTCITWSNDGTRLFIGYINGNIIMCNADSKLYQPNRNVWDLFNQEIDNLKNNNIIDPNNISMENKKIDLNKNDD